jgi:hypothetical protein
LYLFALLIYSHVLLLYYTLWQILSHLFLRMFGIIYERAINESA